MLLNSPPIYHFLLLQITVSYFNYRHLTYIYCNINQSFCNLYMSKNRLNPMSYYSMMKLFVSNKNVCDSWPIISLLLINNQAWIHLWNIQDLVSYRSIAIKTMSDGNSCMSISFNFRTVWSAGKQLSSRSLVCTFQWCNNTPFQN